MKKKTYPKFLCIGAQKAGTTWIFRNLLQHPEIWLPPVKEIHYLSRLDRGIFSGWKSLRKEIWREKLYKSFKDDFVNFSYTKLAWKAKYYFGLRTDKWYASIFELGGNKVSGDITPAYSTMCKRAVEHTYSIMPQAKIIFILRNPIDRAWSHARMSFDKKWDLYEKSGGNFDNIDNKSLIQHFKQKGLILRGDYIRTIKIWESIYPSEQLFYAFNEDITRRPQELLLDIYRFIGVTATELYIPEQIKNIVTPGSEHKIPEVANRYLTEFYYKQINELADRFSTLEVNYPREWLEKAESVLNSESHLTNPI